jgi:hypothetical protein
MERRSLSGIPSAAVCIGLGALLSAPLLIARHVHEHLHDPAGVAVKAEIEPLSFFIGQWNCEGEFVASKKPIASHIAVVPDLDGSWLTFRWDDKTPNQFHALELWGFDKTTKHFTNFIHDNFGGARLFDSPGWDGDTLIWTGDVLASPSALNQRFVIERKPLTREFVISWQVRKPDADWTTGDRLTCRP